jgi:uncharacterized membrane protein YcaP (DUF421 family)
VLPIKTLFLQFSLNTRNLTVFIVVAHIVPSPGIPFIHCIDPIHMIFEEIAKLDWQSLLLGNTSPAFLVQLGIRLAIGLLVVYLAARLAGRSPAGELRPGRLAFAAAIGAAFGGALFVPAVPIALMAAVLVVLLLFQLLLPGKKKAAPKANVPEKVVALVEDGRLMFETMKRQGIATADVFTYLRTEGVEHLGQVRRLYLETNGKFSLYCTQHAKPGLPLLPDRDREMVHEMAVAGHFACGDCGNILLSESLPGVRCTRCGEMSWKEAVLELAKTEKPKTNLYYQRGLMYK